MRKQPVILVLCKLTILLSLTRLMAGEPSATTKPNHAQWLLPVPELEPDPDIPTLQQVVGHRWAEDISSHAQIEQYFHALAKAAPERARLVSYGQTYEGRTLYYLVITSPENLKRLEQIRADNLRLAAAHETDPLQARALTENAPGLVWLAYSVHGNEISCSDAAMLTAYHLLADRSSKTRSALAELVVFIDPLQNPDGRERFINVFRETRGRFPESDPWASEHTERWPGGRFNHYLFDMNRDWFLQTQRETRHKVAAYLHWQPHIYVDAHEMGRNSTYYFAPPTDPINPFMLPRQMNWLFRVGRHQAKRFDQYGFPYTTREIFDAFYPGYGSEWPTLQGGLGILWEQASARGLVTDRDDETKLHYHDGVRHHYISGLATIEVAAENRSQLVADFHEARRRGVQLGQEGPVKHFFLIEGKRPYRAARLAKVLVGNGLQVQRTLAPLRVLCRDTRDAVERERTIPPGSYHVPVAQPAGRLVRVLLDRRVPMGQAFVQRQLRRQKRRQPHEIYDITAWSLPLAYDVDCLATDEPAELESTPWDGESPAGQVLGGQAKVAYLVAGDDDGALGALAWWLRNGYRVHVADRPLKLGGENFPRGTLILKIRENPETLHDAVTRAAQRFHIRIHATDTGFVTAGAHLGGPHVQWVRPPRIAMLVNRPTRYSVGHTWYLLDQVLRYPSTRLAARHLSRLDLGRYNVLILPDGNYTDADAPSETQVARIQEWIRRGGTLLLSEGAAAWATGKKVGLLASRLEKKPLDAASPSGDSSSTNESASTAAEENETRESPDSVPGSFLRADVFDDHWVTFGLPPTLDVFFSGNTILAPIKPTRGRNLVTFRAKDDLLTSGFCWPQTLELIASKPYVMYQARGSGHVIAFSGDPNFRAMCPATQRLFFNAVMFGPGH